MFVRAGMYEKIEVNLNLAGKVRNIQTQGFFSQHIQNLIGNDH